MMEKLHPDSMHPPGLMNIHVYTAPTGSKEQLGIAEDLAMPKQCLPFGSGCSDPLKRG